MTALNVLRKTTLALGAVLVVFFAIAVVGRFQRPTDLEWMTGSVLDHVERARRGLPLYGEPTADFIPFIYPPLYYWVSAALARFVDVVVACRLVSIASTIASGALLYRLSRAVGANRHWSAVAVLLFAAAYSYTGYWYDIERCDSLCVALILAGTLVAVRSERWPGALAAGAVLGVAYLAKQPALFFALAGTGAFVLARDLRRAAALAGGALLVIVPSFAWLDAVSHGWYRYYVFTAPAKHGFLWSTVTLFLFSDAMTAFALAGATFGAWAIVFPDALRRARAKEAADAPALILASMLAAGFFASWSSRLHVGGFPNVLSFWSTIACAGVAFVGSRIDAGTSRTASALACSVALFQLIRFAYDPSEPIPNDTRVNEAAALATRVRQIENAGEVWVWGRGHLTAKPHAHAAALQDVIRGGLPIPADVVRAFDDQRFVALVLEDPSELTLEKLLGRRSELFAMVAASYFVAVRWDSRESEPVVGWPWHPSWVMRRRAKKLVGFSAEALERRHRIEIGICEMRMRAVQGGARALDDGLDVEQVAAELDPGIADRRP